MYSADCLRESCPWYSRCAISSETSTTAARAALACAVALAGHTGTALVADGCDTAEQVTAMRSRGVCLVQGDLLGPWQRRPQTQPVPRVVLDRLTASGPESLSARHPRVQFGPAAIGDGGAPVLARNLAHPPATMPSDSTGESVRAVFADHPGLTGVVLVDWQQRPITYLHRDRFVCAITGPFGYALHARRSAFALGESARALGPTATVADAVDLIAGTPPQRMFDDILVLDHIGRCAGVLRVDDLVRDLVQRHATPSPAVAEGRIEDPAEDPTEAVHDADTRSSRTA